MNILLKLLGLLVAVGFVVRGVAEPFLIDLTDPSTYSGHWGGPSLAGVLTVSFGPAVLAGMYLYGSVVRWRRREVVSSGR
ncbi:hypothetical protein [Actinoplanes derwentensis]|uniref:Uncharacterized protein n=1 Tax=Actinoplanes derwentensis TaxID=113562 RepID=A0A1H2CHR4_9ACTN|nr:hypothetical protein [Actinoplanes derwentensis]GID88702.1 hypothetical protein Ade03nite_76260 [Actinoplanes derwentensis]SDT70038.1 hypothetical protein SAMN04489716_5874 [Actinoplanes derwentensis]